jgi:KUP system potassium uptake protein
VKFASARRDVRRSLHSTTARRSAARFFIANRRDLVGIQKCGGAFNMMSTSFFLGRQKLVSRKMPGMARWRETLFARMLKSSESAMEFFKLPTNRVLELGGQIQI